MSDSKPRPEKMFVGWDLSKHGIAATVFVFGLLWIGASLDGYGASESTQIVHGVSRCFGGLVCTLAVLSAAR